MTKEPITPCDNTTFEPLLDTESSLMYFMSEPAVATVSFFEGADYEKSVEWIKQRLLLICQANPWLLARLVKDKKKHKNCLLAFPQSITNDELEAIMCTQEPSLASISTKTPYVSLSKTIMKSDATVKAGYSLIGKDTRVSKFCLIPVANGEIALIVSITHAVVDGYTYYKIMSMLTEGSDIESLSYVRKHEFVPKMKVAAGKEEHKLLVSPGLTLGMIPSMLWGPKANFDARFIDEEKVRLAKAEAESRSEAETKSEFVCSTNDIITSTFSQAVNADILLMAINLRNRLKEATNQDAGNYESVILFDSPSTAAPESIRKTLRSGAPFKRTEGNKLPGFFKLLKATLAMITNWAFPTFTADLKLVDKNGDPSNVIHLHLPLYDPAAVVCPLAIIFRPRVGKLAVMYAGSSKAVSHERMVTSGVPIGECVSSEMFP